MSPARFVGCWFKTFYEGLLFLKGCQRIS